MAKVCVLTVAWNQVEKTLACLATVFEQTILPDEVILVDNASTDNTIVQVTSQFPEVTVLAQPENRGFAGGYNVGLRYALENDFDYVLLINNDTLLAVDCLQQLLAKAKTTPGAGLITAKIYYAEDRERIWTVGAKAHPRLLDMIDKGNDELDRGQWSEARDIDFAPLCGVLLTRPVLETVGLLDEQYFVYYEDMDYCHRIRKAGFRLRLAPDAVIYHAVSASSGGQNTPMERYWMAQGSGRYFRKMATWSQLAWIVPFRLGSAVKITLLLTLQGKFRAVGAYWLGLMWGWGTGRATHQPPKWVRNG